MSKQPARKQPGEASNTRANLRVVQADVQKTRQKSASLRSHEAIRRELQRIYNALYDAVTDNGTRKMSTEAAKTLTSILRETDNVLKNATLEAKLAELAQQLEKLTDHEAPDDDEDA